MRTAALLAAGLAAGALGAFGWIWLGTPRLAGGASGLPALPAQVDPGLAQVDLATVHGAWPGPSDPRLATWVAPDPTLSAIVGAWGQNSADPRPAAVLWNGYLRLAHQPWRIAVTPDGARFATYRLVEATATQIGEVRIDGEIWDRVGGSLPNEPWIGITAADEPPVVLLDPLVAFTLDRIWPLLDPALAPTLDDLSRRFADPVRSVLGRELSAEEMAILAQTAEDRYWMVRTAEQIASRRTCGSSFTLTGVPWNGLDAREVEALRTAIGRGSAACPEVTDTEMLVFAVRSGRVRRAPALRPALEHLVALVGRLFVLHEARHAFDRGEIRSTLDPAAAREAAAYLATLADPELAMVSAFQLCTAGEVKGARAVSDALGGLCEHGPPPDLPARAADLAEDWFDGRSVTAIHTAPARLSVGGEG
jgi:hypothetical protein